MMYPLFLAILLAAVSPAQIRAPQIPLNPYSIAEDYQRLYNLRLLNNGAISGPREADDCDRYEVQLWVALGIPFAGGTQIGGDRSFCVTEFQEVDWNGDTATDVLLIFGGRVFRQYRYALFLSASERFRYVGYVDGASKYSDPIPKVVRFGQQTFLQTVLTTDDARLNKSDVIWSEFTLTGARRVFSYPAVGVELGADLIREWDGSTQVIDAQSGALAVDLRTQYSATPESGDQAPLPLFTTTHQIVYQWNPNSSRFEVEPVRSIVGPDRINEVSGGSLITDLLNWYLPELTGLAEKGSAEQKQWLRSWLERQPASSQQQTLLELLSK